MNHQPPRLTARQRYLENRQRKQNLTFSVTASVMSVLVIVSLLVILGVVVLPFGQTFSASVKVARAGDIPCPTAGATPADPASVTVQVLNATSQGGLAGTVTQMLKKQGFTMLEPANASSEVPTAVEIDAGPRAVDDAYTVARFFPDARITLTNSTDSTVTVIVGTFYAGVLGDDEAAKVAKDTGKLTGQAKCLPIDPLLLQEQSGAQSGQSGAESGSQSGK